jgi:hypothetical protein
MEFKKNCQAIGSVFCLLVFINNSPLCCQDETINVPIVNEPVQISAENPYKLNRSLPTQIQLKPPIISKKDHPIKIAFYNILTTHATDKEPKKTKYPQYLWRKHRARPVIQLIQKDKPTVLGLCELDLKQTRRIRRELKKGRRLEGYKLVGFSSVTKKTIGTTEKRFSKGQQHSYGEFVAFLVDSRRIKVKKMICHPLHQSKGQRWKRILVQANLYDTVTKTHFVCLASHFDHLSLESRVKSAEKELKIIQELEDKNIPWFSISDRNWSRNNDGELCAQEYAKKPYICDFRDETKLGQFGQPGTFPGHLWLSGQPIPKTTTTGRHIQIIDAPTVDTGYRSKRLVDGIYYYTKTGEFDPVTGNLIASYKQGDLTKRYFASDHYLFGGVFYFKTVEQKALSVVAATATTVTSVTAGYCKTP